MDDRVFTTYQAAKLCNVHHTTVINWVKEGKVKAYITPGGHRRIEKHDLLEFMKKYGIPLPEVCNHKKKVVLVVDDDPEMREELRDMLSGHGFNLDFAADGFEAGRKIYRRKPDLILLDFKMPGMDGFEVCEILSNDEETKDIPIFAVTVLISGKDINRIKKCGILEYIPKPIDPQKLLKKIHSALKK